MLKKTKIKGLSLDEKQCLKLIGMRIAEARNSAGFTQKELWSSVENIDIDKALSNRMSEIEKGLKNIDIMQLRRLAIALNVSPSYLLGMSNEPDIRSENRYISEMYHGVNQLVCEQVSAITNLVVERAIEYSKSLPEPPMIELIGMVKQFIETKQNRREFDAEIAQLSEAVRRVEVSLARKSIEAFKVFDDVIDEMPSNVEKLNRLSNEQQYLKNQLSLDI